MCFLGDIQKLFRYGPVQPVQSVQTDIEQMASRGPFQAQLFCDSMIFRYIEES